MDYLQINGKIITKVSLLTVKVLKRLISYPFVHRAVILTVLIFVGYVKVCSSCLLFSMHFHLNRAVIEYFTLGTSAYELSVSK